MQNKLIPLALAAIAIKIGYYLTCSFINQNNLSLVSSLIFYVPFIGLHIAIFFAIIKHNEFGRYAFLVTVILGYMLFFDGEPIPNTQIKNELQDTYELRVGGEYKIQKLSILKEAKELS